MRRLSLWGFAASAFLWLGIVPAGATAPIVPPPIGLRGVRQDQQAVRLSWKDAGNDVGYYLYAAYDSLWPDFHKENTVPLHQDFAIWDAPFKGKRAFVFYVTAVDKEGRESAPSQRVRVDLGKKE